jgi:hypothetical protein
MATIERLYPRALVVDVTSKASEPWVRFSPFYPHGDIPVPYSPGVTSQTVEGIWQALKVFESADVDESKLEIANMKGIKRTARRNGPVLGHRMGLTGEQLFPYIEARRHIYLPSYLWVLQHKVRDLVEELRGLTRERDVVLLDYTTNGDINDASRPLSHAALLKCHVESDWPT